jgi:hypothetical protein
VSGSLRSLGTHFGQDGDPEGSWQPHQPCPATASLTNRHGECDRQTSSPTPCELLSVPVAPPLRVCASRSLPSSLLSPFTELVHLRLHSYVLLAQYAVQWPGAHLWPHCVTPCCVKSQARRHTTALPLCVCCLHPPLLHPSISINLCHSLNSPHDGLQHACGCIA